MELALVPDEDGAISEQEKQRAEQRVREIPPEDLASFDEEHRKRIKHFLTTLIVLSERFHHYVEHAEEWDDAADYEQDVAELHARRHQLFENPMPVIALFIEMLHFFPMEPWPEFDMMIAGIRGEDLQTYYEAKLEGTNPRRITPCEIDELVHSHSLEGLVKNLIQSRRLMAGEFWGNLWENSHYAGTDALEDAA